MPVPDRHLARAGRLLLLALVALLLGGCLAPPPRLRVESHHGTVRADSVAPAANTARLLDDLVPRVVERLPDTRTDRLEVWVQAQLEVYSGWPVEDNVPAFTVESDGRIHLLEGSSIELSAALGHELVHAMLGPSWKTLPAVAEEGLADWMQEQLNPQVVAALRADHLAKAAAAVGGMQFGIWGLGPAERGQRLATLSFPEDLTGERPLDPRTALDDGDGERGGLFQPYSVAVSDPRLYGIGYLVVARIVERGGIELLHDLCLQAATQGYEHVPADWLLEAADLGGGAATWRRIVNARVEHGELMALGRQLVPALVALVVDDIGPRSGARSGREFLRSARPVFGLVEGELRLDLDDLPGFGRALRSAWPGRVRVVADGTVAPERVSSAPASLRSDGVPPALPTGPAAPARRALP